MQHDKAAIVIVVIVNVLRNARPSLHILDVASSGANYGRVRREGGGSAGVEAAAEPAQCIPDAHRPQRHTSHHVGAVEVGVVLEELVVHAVVLVLVDAHHRSDAAWAQGGGQGRARHGS